MTAAISVSGVAKDLGTTRALDRLVLTVGTGEVHGFLGPNGASKSNVGNCISLARSLVP